MLDRFSPHIGLGGGWRKPGVVGAQHGLAQLVLHFGDGAGVFFRGQPARLINFLASFLLSLLAELIVPAINFTRRDLSSIL